MFLFQSDTGGDPTSAAISEAMSDLMNGYQDIFVYGFGNTLIFTGIVAVITFIVTRLLKHFLKKVLSGNLRIFYQLIYVIVIVIAVSAVLMTIKPLRDISVIILASSGVAAVVIGLAAQQTLGNVFSGFSISLGKPFEVGDYIEIFNTTPPIAGVVKSIGLRHTTILDASNKSIEVPNSILDKEMVRTAHSSTSMNVINYLDVGIAYTSDIDLAMQTLSALVEQHPSYVDTRTAEDKKNGVPPVTLRVTDLGAYAIGLRAFVWTEDAVTGFKVLSDLRYSVKKEFDRLGIELPYPYQNVILQQTNQPEPPKHGSENK